MAVISTVAVCSLLLTGGVSPVSNMPPVTSLVSWSVMVQDALGDNPAVLGKRSLADSSSAGVDTAFWQFFPTPSANVERLEATTDASYRGTKRVSKLVLQQSLWTGGRLTANLDAARARDLAAQADLELARLQLTQKIIENFGDWYLAYAKVRVAQINLLALEKKMALITSRIEQGLAAPVDRVFVVGRLEQLKSDLLSLQSQQRVAHTKLNQALGRSVPLAELERHMAIPAREESFSDDDILALSRQHPSVVRAEAQMKIQETEIAVAKADLQPDVYLKVDRQYGNYIYENLAPQNHTFVGLNTRFGPGLSNRSIIASALAKLEAAKQDQEQSQRVMFEQLSNDLTLVQAMPTRLRALYAAMTAAQETVDSWERQYLVGRKNWQDIINAHRELQIASYAFHEAHITWFVASWRLRIHAAGLENSFSTASQTTLCNP